MGDLKGQLTSYASAVWQRRWLILLTTWVVAVIGWAAVWHLPDQYQSKARIHVDTDSLIKILLGSSIVSPNIGQQVEIMQQTLLSRPNLEKVARFADLDLRADDPKELDAIVNKLSAGIKVNSRSRNLFDISYTGTDPASTRNVVSSLVSIFVESNLGASRADLDNARRTLSEQIDQYEAKLKAAERRLADFKRENMDLLPSGGSYLASLEAARNTVTAIRYELEDAQLRRQTLQSQLQTLPPTIEVNSGSVTSGASETRQRIVELERRLSDLLLVYTERHPDVVATRRTLENLRQQPGASSSATVTPVMTTIPNAVYEQVKLDLVQTETEISRLERRLQQAEMTLAEREEKAKAVPEIDAQFADMNRDYDVLRRQYESLIAKREALSVTDVIEARGDQVQFRVVEQPSLPLAPSGPNRPLLMAAVLVAALGVGVGGALVLAQIDDSFGSVHDLRRSFVVPVLGGVSLAATPSVRRRQMASNLGLAIASLGLVVAFGGIMYLQLATSPFVF